MSVAPAPVALYAPGRQPRPEILWPAGAVVALALLFGGASQQNALQLGFLELACLPVLLLQVWRISREGAAHEARAALLIAAALALIPVIQLVPLPPAVWAAAAGRSDLATDLRLAGAQDAWRPLSLAPDLTLRCALALIPPMTAFLLALSLDRRGRMLLFAGLVAFALLSVLLGVAQQASGPQSGLRFYPRTNVHSAVGFFSNRNHFAVLLVCVMPLAAAVAMEEAVSRRRLALAACVAIYLVLVVGIGVSHSRAATLLLVPAMIGSLLIVFLGKQSRNRPLAALFGAAGLAGLALLGTFALSGLMSRFQEASENELRWKTAPVVMDLGLRYAPWGAGVGAFDPVYRAAEPNQLLAPQYLNHAHNDWLEVWLEAGVPGLLVLAAFLGWFLTASWRAWRLPAEEGAPARAASIVVVILMAASVVDYPLRTTAMAVVLAFSCGMLVRNAPLAAANER